MPRHCCLGGNSHLLTRRSRVQISLNHASFVRGKKRNKTAVTVSHVKALPTYVWKIACFSFVLSFSQICFVNEGDRRPRIKGAWGDGEEEEFFEQRPEEPQTSTTNHLFRILGVDGQNSWLDVFICGWNAWSNKERRQMVWMISLIKWPMLSLLFNWSWVERKPKVYAKLMYISCSIYINSSCDK